MKTIPDSDELVANAPGARLIQPVQELSDEIERITGIGVSVLYLADEDFDRLNAAEASFFKQHFDMPACSSREFSLCGILIRPASDAK